MMFKWAAAALLSSAAAVCAGAVDFSVEEKDFPFVDAWLGEFADELGEAVIFGEEPQFQYLKPGDRQAGGPHGKAWRLYTTAAKFFEANADFLSEGRRLDESGKLEAAAFRVFRMNGLPNKECHPRIHHAVWEAKDGRKALFLANVSWASGTKWSWEGFGKSFSGRMNKYTFAVIPLWDVPDSVDAVAGAGGPKRIQAKPYPEGGPQYPAAIWELGAADWSPYDRLVVDVVSHGVGGDKLTMYIKDAWTKNKQDDWVLDTFTPGFHGVYRWVVPLCQERENTFVQRRVKQLHVFAGSPDNPDYEFASLRLVRRGAPLPPALPVPEEVSAARRAYNAARAAERLSAMDGMLASGPMRVGLATTMDKIRPDRPLPSPHRLAPGSKACISLARNEHEGFQVLVGNAGRDAISGVRVSVYPLSGPGGAVLPATNVAVGVTGYVKTRGRPRYNVGYNEAVDSAPGYRRKTRKVDPGWYPDPILGFIDAVDVRPTIVQSFWVDVKCPEVQPAGVYSGTLRVSADGVRAVEVPLEVTVRDFAISRSSPIPMAVSFCPSSQSPCYAAVESCIDEWTDFLADHFVTIDSLYLSGRPRWKQLLRLKEQGRLNRFELSMWGDFMRSPEAEKAWYEPGDMNSGKPRLDAAYAKAKELGLLDHAYIYGMDEQPADRFPAMKASLPYLKKWYPGVPIMTTCYDYTYGEDGVLSDIDVFIPDTTKYDRAKADVARAHGRHVWWYLACVPHAPYANFFVECEGIEPRSLMGPQAVKYRPEGFLYYATAIWRENKPVEKGPFTDWNPFSWGSPGNEYNGDGSWTIPGPGGRPLETVRLYNFRDGLEDYAYAKELFSRTGEWPEVPDWMVESVTNFNSSAEVHYRWRDDLAARIEKAGKK